MSERGFVSAMSILLFGLGMVAGGALAWLCG